jgi:hypothetical protein
MRRQKLLIDGAEEGKVCERQKPLVGLQVFVGRFAPGVIFMQSLVHAPKTHIGLNRQQILERRAVR